MKIWSYTIVYNEAVMLPWFLKHYETWVDKMIFYDDKSTDGTREIIQSHPKAELREWPFQTGLDDEKFREVWNKWYREAAGKADWVLVPDCDEILYRSGDIRAHLESTKYDMLGGVGYALISKTGWPEFDGSKQLYDLVRTGSRQSNYDKKLIYRPSVHVEHAIGRHSYPPDWPKCSGKQEPQPSFTLLHCHHVGGIKETDVRNKRNYDRAHNKRYAWNMLPEVNTPQQVGTVAWVEDLLARDALYDVVSEAKMKINFGCGSNLLEGWRNHDLDCNITKPLPYGDSVADYVFCEHCPEHITHQEAWNFFVECKRILKPGGVLRIAIPDITRMSKKMTDEYRNAVKAGGHGDNPIRAAIFSHGHQAAWNQDLLITFLQAIGFKAEKVEMGKSKHAALVGVEGHGKVVGHSVADVETSCVEATNL